MFCHCEEEGNASVLWHMNLFLSRDESEMYGAEAVPGSSWWLQMVLQTNFRHCHAMPDFSTVSERNQPYTLLELMCRYCPCKSKFWKFIFINILRRQINAMANRATGKGYENENFYSNIKFQFLGIENIHVMRSSLQKLIEGLFQRNVGSFLWCLLCFI